MDIEKRSFEIIEHELAETHLDPELSPIIKRVIHTTGAGSFPADKIHPLAYEVLMNAGFDMIGKKPKSMELFSTMDFDFIITLCDSMQETCPIFPGQPICAHWGMHDPVEFQGNDDEKLRFFKKTMLEIVYRINLFLSLPFETLDRLALELKVREIGKATP